MQFQHLIGLAVMVYELLYHALHIWSVYASVQNWKLAEIFFAKDRTAPEANCFNSFLRILEMQFHQKKKDKNKQKATRACLKVCRKAHENTWN